MKKGILIAAAILVSSCISFQNLNGQEKTQEQKDKEAKLQQAIELQKKQMQEQKIQFDQQKIELDKAVQDAKDEVVRSNGDLNFTYKVRPPRVGRDISDQSFYVAPDYNWGGSNFYFHGDMDGERTTWDFSKNVKEASFSKQYSFDVEKSAENVVMMVMGDCKSGEIRVKIIMPGGKTYSDILIDESGNLNWRKSFSISDDENKDKRGEWIFKIDASKATGSFKISLQTY